MNGAPLVLNGAGDVAKRVVQPGEGLRVVQDAVEVVRLHEPGPGLLDRLLKLRLDVVLRGGAVNDRLLDA